MIDIAALAFFLSNFCLCVFIFFRHRFEVVVAVHETFDKSTSHLIKGQKPKWYRNIYKANYISTNICTSNYSLTYLYVIIMCGIYTPGVGNL